MEYILSIAMQGVSNRAASESISRNVALDIDIKDNTEKHKFSFSHHVDGSMLMTVADKTLVIGKTTVDALNSRYKAIFQQRFSLSSFGYPKLGFDLLYQLVIKCFPDKKTEALDKWRRYFEEFPEDKLVIMHLNDNPLDFNVENLMWGPQRLKLTMRKSLAYQHGSQFRGQVTVRRVKFYSRPLPSREEALHHVDILKLTAPGIPKIFLETIFLYGLNRPAGFEQYYDSMETLIARATLPQYRRRSKQKRVAKQRMLSSSAQYIVFDSTQAFLLDERPSQDLRDNILGEMTLGRPNCEPFSEELDCIVLYVGARGKKIAVVLERKDLPILQYRSLGSGSEGHIKFQDGEQEYLHHAIMGYEKGKQVSHGPGKVLDNRRRTMNHETSSEINSTTRNVSSTLCAGVYERKAGKKWGVRLAIFEGKAPRSHIGYFSNEADASAAAGFAANNRAEFRLRTIHMTEKAKNDYVRRCCRAQKLLLVDESEWGC
eukprot:gene24588-33053_t